MIIFDASTLILTAKVEILRKVASRIDITIPKAIEEESTGKNTMDAKLIEKLIEEEKIKVMEVEVENKVNKLKEEFAIGDEAYAIQLAERESRPLATDDKQAIKVCKVFGMEFTTAIDFLIRVYERGEISQPIAMEKLKNLEVYGRYSQEIISLAKQRLGGEKGEDN